MGIPVAVEVKEELSSKNIEADIDKTGKWALSGSVVMVKAANIKTESGEALLSASATFIYSGGKATVGTATSPVPPVSSPLELKAGSTKLTSSGNALLIDGDEVEDSFGNKLLVSKVSSKASTA